MASKAAKEAFVTNLHGTSMLEVSALSLAVPAAMWLRSALWSRAPRGAARWGRAALLALEFAAVVLPVLGSLVLPEPTMALLAVLLLLDGVQRAARGVVVEEEDAAAAQRLQAARKTFVSNFRACMMLTTCVRARGLAARAHAAFVLFIHVPVCGGGDDDSETTRQGGGRRYAW